MEVDLKEIEAKLKRMLEQLDARESLLKEEFRALERQQPSTPVDTSNPDVSTQEVSDLESQSPGSEVKSPPEPPGTREGTLQFQDDARSAGNPAQAEPSNKTTPPREVPAAQGERLGDTSPDLPQAPEAPAAPEPAPAISAPTAPEKKDARSLKEQIAGSSMEEAVLAVLRSLKTRLKPAKIAEELLAAGYPFPGENPRDLVMNVLHDMARNNKNKTNENDQGDLLHPSLVDLDGAGENCF